MCVCHAELKPTYLLIYQWAKRLGVQRPGGKLTKGRNIHKPFELRVYWQRRQTLKSVIFVTFGTPWRWSWTESYITSIYIQIVAIIKKKLFAGERMYGRTNGQWDWLYYDDSKDSNTSHNSHQFKTTVTTAFQHRIYNFPTYNIIVRAAIEFFWRLESSTRTNTLTITRVLPKLYLNA